MDIELKRLIREWWVTGDRSLQVQIDARAKRIGGFTCAQVKDIRLLASHILSESSDSFQTDLAQQYVDVEPGQQLHDDPTDLYVLGEAVVDLLRPRGQRHIYPEYLTASGDIEYHDKRLLRAALSQCRCMNNRWSRGCGQPARGCICGTLCVMCKHCTGCMMHASDCVCSGFGYRQVGSAGWGAIGFETHYLDYLCGCRGSGWQHTDADSVHECPIHPITSHHPECGNYDGDITECCVLTDI